MATGDLKGLQEVSGPLYTEVRLQDVLLTDIIGDTTPQLGGELDANGHTIGVDQQTITYNGTTTTVDWRLGNKASVTATGNIGTFAFTNPSKPCNLLLKFIHSGAGRTVTTWDADIKWVGAAPPILSTGAGNVDIISFYFDGTNYYGMVSLNFA